MAVPRYTDFDLGVDPGQGGYRVTALKAPAGQGATGFFPPFPPAALVDFLGHVQGARDAIRLQGRPQEGSLEQLREFGEHLYQAVFGGEVGGSLLESLQAASTRGLGLRLRLHLPSELADLPWECLYRQELDRFLCLSVDTPVVRYLEVQEPPRVSNVKPPLRILVMISSPNDYPPLGTEAEWSKLDGALTDLEGRGLVALHRLEDATMLSLQNWLRDNECHVFHFIGHGGFDVSHQDGVLVMEGPQRKGELVPGDDLGIVLHDHRPLRLVVLNACEGARGSPKDPFAGTAQGLIQQRVPAVIAMQFPISDGAATTFAQQFYAAIARGYPVDAALGEARKTIYITGNRLEWLTPVLYMRSPNGRIFNVEGALSLEARAAEVDPLVPADGEGGPPPTSIAAEGKVFHLDNSSGAAVTAAAPGTWPTPRIRLPPIDLRPKDFTDLLGRDAEVRAVTAAFLAADGTASAPVEIYGQAGVGKTALVRNVAHHPAAQFPNGVVYTSTRQAPEDLLRFLFQTFYETVEPFMPSEADIRRYLQDVQALVQLDDVALSRDELGMLANVAPKCLFLLSSEQRVLWEEGPAIALRGLAEAAAFELLERRLGRPLTPDEQTAARSLVAAVGGLPLLLVQAASRVRDEGRSIPELAAEAGASLPGAPSVGTPALSEAESRVAAVLGAVGAPLSDELIAAATDIGDVHPALDALQGRGIAQSHSPRYSLTQSLPPELNPPAGDTTWQERALVVLLSWAEARRRDDPFRLLEEADALLGIMGWAESRERWSDVIRLGRAIEATFALAARWSRWEEVLLRVLRAARAIQDRGQEAWALHQLGTRSIGLDLLTDARALLVGALRLRVALGDGPGIQVTRQNLEFAGGAPPEQPPQQPGEPRPPERGPGGGARPPRWRRGLVVLGAISAIGAGAVAAIAFLAPNPATTTTRTSSAVAPAGIRVDRTALDFGDLSVDSLTTAQTVTITSTGGALLVVQAPRIEGDNRGDFTVAEDTCPGDGLARGLSCTIQVGFVPTAEGSRLASLVIDHNAEGSPLTVELTGRGVPGPTTVRVPGIDVQPSEGLSFADPQGRETVTITSTGTAPLQISDVSLDPPEEGKEFAVTVDTACSGSLDRGQTCMVGVSFVVNDQLVGSANLRVASNATTDPILVPLSGVPKAGIDTSGFVVSETETITVTDVGTALLSFTGFGISGADAGDFAIMDNSCQSLHVGEACTITVAFQPAVVSTGTHTAVLAISDTSPEGTHEVPLSVTVIG